MFSGRAARHPRSLKDKVLDRRIPIQVYAEDGLTSPATIGLDPDVRASGSPTPPHFHRFHAANRAGAWRASDSNSRFLTRGSGRDVARKALMLLEKQLRTSQLNTHSQ